MGGYDLPPSLTRNQEEVTVLVKIASQLATYADLKSSGINEVARAFGYLDTEKFRTKALEAYRSIEGEGKASKVVHMFIDGTMMDYHPAESENGVVRELIPQYQRDFSIDFLDLFRRLPCKDNSADTMFFDSYVRHILARERGYRFEHIHLHFNGTLSQEERLHDLLDGRERRKKGDE